MLLAFALSLVACSERELKSRGNSAMMVGDFARAKQAWSALLDLDPADKDARTGFAMTLFAEARSREQAQENAATLWDSCANEFAILLKMDSSTTVRGMASTALFHQAHAWIGKEQFAKARRALDQSIQLDSANGFSWNLLGLSWEGIGDTAQAREAYETGIARQPSLVACYVNLGNLHWRSKRIVEAWEFWTMGLEQDSGNSYLQYWKAEAERKLEEQALQ